MSQVIVCQKCGVVEPCRVHNATAYREFQRQFTGVPEQDQPSNLPRPEALETRLRDLAGCPHLYGSAIFTFREAANALAARDREIARLQEECARWKEAAYKKIRTWESLQGMHRAGDSIEVLAKDFYVPVEWVRFVMFPENDLDARYGRPSDRTKTAKARAEAAEAQLAQVREYAQHKSDCAKWMWPPAPPERAP